MNTKPISLLLLLLFIFKFNPSFSQADNDGGDEENGRSCETAYFHENDVFTTYTLDNGQEEQYLYFTASGDSMEVYFQAITAGVGATINTIEVFAFENCEEEMNLLSTLDHIDSLSGMLVFSNLQLDQNYLIKIKRENNLNFGKYRVRTNKSVQYPCPASYDLACGELIKNGGFDYTTIAIGHTPGTAWLPPFWWQAFSTNYVCEWQGQSSDLVATNSNNFASMLPGQQYNLSGEYIMKSINLNPGDYVLSFDLCSGPIKPQSFYVKARNSTTSQTQILTRIPKTQIQSGPNGTYNFKNETFSFSLSNAIDEIYFYATGYFGSNSIDYRVYLDNVSLKDTDFKPTVDQNISLSGCNSTVRLGPETDCIFPNVSYHWSPSIGLSDTNIANPLFTSPSPNFSQTYTLTVTTYSTQYTISVNVSNTTSSVSYDYFIPHGSTSTWLHNNYPASIDPFQPFYQYYSGETFFIAGDFIIDDPSRWHNCNFYMGENARILFDQQSAIFEGLLSGVNFMKPCDPERGWDGIYTSEKSNLSVYYYQIEGSRNGINMKDESGYGIVGNDFINNGKSITVENYDGPFVGPPYIPNIGDPGIVLNRFRCTEPIQGEYGLYYPMTAVEIKNYDDRNIPTAQLDLSRNTFEGSGGSLLINDAYINLDGNTFKDFNNEFFSAGAPTKQTTAIRVNGSIRNPEFTIDSNYFFRNNYGIRLDGNIKTRVVNNFVNIDYLGTHYVGPEESTFLRITNNQNNNVGNGNAPYNDLHYIGGNDIYNVKRGMEFYNALYYYVHNNIFDMEVQANSNAYTEKDNKESVAIYANDYNNQLIVPINSPFIIEANNIKHSKVGIQTEFMLTEIRDNVIEDMNNNFSVSSQCYPYPPIGVSCSQTPAYGIRALNSMVTIAENQISNSLNQYSGTMPNTQDKVIGIAVENTYGSSSATPIYTYHQVNCNKTEKTGFGVRFSGYLGAVDLYNNNLISNKYGISTDNEAFISDIGTVFSVPNNTYQDAANTFSNFSVNSRHTFNFSNLDPNNPPKYYALSGTGPSIVPTDAAVNYFAFQKTTTTNTNSISCTAPQLVRYEDGKADNAYYRNKSGRVNQTPHWNRKGNGSDSALYLRQQLQFYHLSKDSARYNSQQFSSFRDSMKNTPLGRALGKNSRAILMSRSSLNNFDQNVITVEPILNKHFADLSLTQAELDQLRQIAVLCPYTDGIAVYQARRVLHEYGDRLLVNDCEISKRRPNNNGKSNPRVKVLDSTAFNLNLYPNPVDQALNLVFESNQELTYTVEIRDVLGKKMLDKNVIPSIQNKLDVSKMQLGVYLLRLKENGRLVQTEKVVIQ